MPGEPPVRLEDLDSSGDGRRYSPSAARNREEIVAALIGELGETGLCLEVAAGTGEHAVLAAKRLAGWTWWPTDRDPEALESLSAWIAQAGLPNLREPMALDLHDLSLGGSWPCGPKSLDAVFASNLLHIAPIETAEALFQGAARCLRVGGCLLIYGAFFLPDTEPVDSNLEFDTRLREQDPRYGVRQLADLEERAVARGLTAPSVRPMPNNNFLLRFDRF